MAEAFLISPVSQIKLSPIEVIMILGDIVKRNAKRYPQKTAVVFGSQRFTFEEFHHRVNSLANALIDLGLGPEDRVAILMDNGYQYLELYFAIPGAKGVAVPVNTSLNTPDMLAILNSAEAKILIYGDKFAPLVDTLLNELDSVKSLIVVGDPVREARSYEQLVAAYPSREPAVKVEEQDLAYLFYTSGTTGLPKGVMLTHRATTEGSLNHLFGARVRHQDIGLVATPLFWGGAMILTILPQFYMGGTIVIAGTSAPEEILGLIQSEMITTGFMTPPMIMTMIEHPQLVDYDTSSLRHVWFAGMPMPVDTLKRALKIMGNIFFQCYGSTELLAMTHLVPEEQVTKVPPDKVRRLASVGREVPNVEVRVVNDEGRDVTPGEVGEVIGRGDNMMKGYWRMPLATEEALKDGFMHTGDLATIDEDGYIYLVGRKKDLIVSGGQTIYAIEVEEVIYQHPGIAEAAVIGVPDEDLGESVKAVVVLRTEEVSTDDIIEFCRQRLPVHAVPKSCAIIEALPRNPAGKVLRRVLRQQYQS
ncbi:MAG: long-chain-fatty-acid--CoA ligase [Chloroflexi bacterium]|nr:long-chain-fatty-acid--CoA ligase [Chloroflexota bacterium]